MDKKAVLAIVLSIGVLVLYQYFVVPKQTPAPAGQTSRATVSNVPATQTPTSMATAPAAVLPKGAAPVPEHIITIETDQYVARFSTVGGVPDYWMLKKYKGDTKETKNQNVVILSTAGTPPPLAVGLTSDFDTSHLNFSYTGGDLKLGKNNPEGTLTFEYSTGQAFIKRTYTFHNGQYRVDLKDEVKGFPMYNITLGPDFGIYSRQGGRGVHVGPLLLSGTNRIEVTPKKLDNTTVSYTEDVKWIAQEDKYFCAALLPKSRMDEAQAFMQNGNPIITFKTKNPSVEEFALYAGPKSEGKLAALGSGLQYIVDYGFFSIISRPIFWLLKLINSGVGNYGWSIILLTILIRIPFLPIVAKGQKSMKKLQMVQPMMNEIRQKYKKDPQRMQRETMELYKKHKVNPMGGCLPMLLQIPVFFALYKVLLISIELRGAPFALWITDLSLKDPYYVLPIIMGITMFIQQKMTPTSAANPAQQKLMLFMPVIFTFMFLNFASGLVLYWLVNNLLSITQQAYINRKVTV
ncbi:MAG: membrane protein insertase YidC [Nitrospiraceae bacterium]|nr:membrane protein insertase YidC [Nitrospiraceae bacterium]